MKTSTRERCRYHVGPWRRAFPWLVFGPFLLLAAGAALFGATAEDRGTGLLLLLILGPLVLGIHALISYARLELDAEGVRLRQLGMNLAAPWSNVAGLRLERRREGIVTRRPISGRGAANLAALRGVGFKGTAMYDEEQRAVMAERRWIPIEAFAWHLRRGRLREDLAHFAPAVAALPSQIAPLNVDSSPASSRRRLIGMFGAMGAAFGAVILAVLSPSPWADRITTILFALLAPYLAFRAGWSARNAFRSRAWILGMVFVFLSIIGASWTLLAWSDAIQLFRGLG